MLHVSRLAEIAPAYVIEAHQQVTRGLFEFATSAAVCGLLAELAAAGDAATPDIVLANLWTDLVRLES